MQSNSQEATENQSENLERLNVSKSLDMSDNLPSTSGWNLSGSSTSSIPDDLARPGSPDSKENSDENDQYEELALLDKGISVNKMMDFKYQKLESVLFCRFRECRQKLKEVQTLDVPLNIDKDHFRYIHCGKPYFKDSNNIPAPCNDDTILMKKHQMYDFSTLSSVPGWTIKDKTDFVGIILKMSQDIKINELNSKISEIQRQSKEKNADEVDMEVSNIRSKIEAVSKQVLKDVALPIDQEYDWDTIANMLHHRHSAEECRSLWKLYLHPSINKNKWSKTEHANLVKIAKENNFQDWDKIAKDLNSGRSGYQCFVYYRTNTQNEYAGKKWTVEEEEYLKRAIEFYREGDYIPWGKVAASMENRTKISVYNKYMRLEEKRKGRFLPEEDAVILTCVEDFGANFQRMKKHLPGRSIIQLRNRYQLLMKTRVSTVWTAEEDKKLIQLMANQEEMTNYSSVTQHFPGKNRIHLRARYLTLVKWMKQYPNLDISFAPRRGARRLRHGKATKDLEQAVEKLTIRMDSQDTPKTVKGLNEDSAEHEIEDAIIALLATEAAKERSKSKNEKRTYFDNAPISTKNISVTNLQKVLLLLRARLNEKSFKNSQDYKKYQGVDDANQAVSLVHVKSYSKKNKAVTVTVNCPDIYGNKKLGSPEYVLPPNMATMTACRMLITYVNESDQDLKSFLPVLKKKNPILKEQMATLIERFNTLFLWPLLLSNQGPRDDSIPSTSSAEIAVPGTSKTE